MFFQLQSHAYCVIIIIMSTMSMIFVLRIIMGNSEGEKMLSHIHQINYTILAYERMERGWNI